MRKVKILLVILFMFAQKISAQTSDEFFNKADAFFKTYVTNGRVEYKALHKDPIILNDLIGMTKSIDVSEAEPNTYKAFWINAYNLLVIQGIVENYPLKSPLDIDGFFDKNKHELGIENVTLNQIENQLLHGKYPEEPRFHFVLVCAGLGCPPIIKEAYRPERLKVQIDRQTKDAINDPNFIRVNENEVLVSQIFEWYKSDFDVAGGVVSFINKYKTEKIDKDIIINYYPYDWTLNSVH